MSRNYENLNIEEKGSVLIIRIDRQASLNALNIKTIEELHSEFSLRQADDNVRCIIITGAGEKAFVAGADISEIAKLDKESGSKFATNGHALMDMIQNFSVPVIAAINGFALGGGCELALACDIRLASNKAKFGQPEVNLGLLPGYGGTQRLPRLVGRGKAMQLILTGALISADEAHRIGLVDEVYPHDELMDKAISMAELICSKAPLAVGMSKDCINRGIDTDLSSGCNIEKESFGSICGSDDKNEGTAAFLEKRRPKFVGK